MLLEPCPSGCFHSKSENSVARWQFVTDSQCFVTCEMPLECLTLLPLEKVSCSAIIVSVNIEQMAKLGQRSCAGCCVQVSVSVFFVRTSQSNITSFAGTLMRRRPCCDEHMLSSMALSQPLLNATIGTHPMSVEADANLCVLWCPVASAARPLSLCPSHAMKYWFLLG